MAESPFEVNTNGICLVCLASKNCGILNDWKEEVDSRTPTAFKMLLRYLRVEVGVGDSIGIVSLCEGCSQVANDFLELYQDFENIRLQLDVCVGQLYEFMEAGGQDPGRVREFEALVNSGEREAQKSARIVILRKQVIDKVSRKVGRSFPRISMGTKLKETAGKVNIANNSSPVQVRLQIGSEEKPSFRAPEKQCEPCVCVFTEKEESTTDLCCDISTDKACVAFKKSEREHPEEMMEADLETSSQSPVLPEEIFGHVTEICNDDEDDDDDSIENQSDTATMTNQIAYEHLRSSVSTEEGECVDIDINYEIKFEAVEMTDENNGGYFGIGDDKSEGAGKPSGTSGLLEQVLRSGESRKDSSVALTAVEQNRRCGELQRDPLPPLDAVNSELETSQPWKCSYCDKRCSRKDNLVSHQLQVHAKSFLSDEGRLPPHISEEELNASMAAVFEKLDPHHRLQCPFCERKAVQYKSDLRMHLLNRHLEKVLENRGKEGLRRSSNVGQVTRWKCIPCQKHFSSKVSLQTHLLSIHTMTQLSSEGRLPTGISEEQLEKSLKNIIDRVDNSTFQCPLCDKSGFDKRKSHLRTHLLQAHLQEIVERVKELLSLADENESSRNDTSASLPAPSRFSDLKPASRKQILSSRRKRNKIKVQSTPKPRVPAKILCGPQLQKDTDIWKCIPCGKRFSRKGNFQTHQMKIHPKTVLKKKLPPSISEENLITAADRIAMGVGKKLGFRQAKHQMYKCALCNKRRMIRMDNLRVHVLRRHLDQVIQEVGVGSVVEQS